MTRARVLLALSAFIVGFPIVVEQFAGLRATHFSDLSFRQPIALSTSNVSTDALLADVPGQRYGRFSVEWSGYLHVTRPGRYVFLVVSSGHSAVLINGLKVAGDLDVGDGAQSAGNIELEPGVASVVIRHAHEVGPPVIAFLMAREGETPRTVPVLALSPTRRSPMLYESASLLQPLGLPVAAAWGLFIAIWLIRRVLAPSMGITAAATALFVAAVIYDRPIWLRGPAPYPEGWRWSYQVLDSTGRWGPAIVAGMTLLAILALIAHGARARGSRFMRAQTIAWLTAATVAGLAFQMSLLHFEMNGAVAALAQRTLSDDITSYFSVAANDRRSVPQLLTTYAADMPRRDRHASSHPPGPILYYRSVIDIFRRAPRVAASVFRQLELTGVERAQVEEGRTVDDPLLVAAIVGGFGLACCAALTAWPVAAVARAAGADFTTAAQTGVLWAFCPGPALFSPQFDQTVTLLVASACMLGCFATRTERRARRISAALAAGATAGAAVFCSFGAVPMLAAAGLVAILVAPQSHRTWGRLGEIALLCLLGFSAISALPMLAGYDFFLTAREALSVSRYEYEIKRSYELWLRFNLLDFAYFLGLPIVSWGLIGVVTRLRGRASATRWRLDLYAAVAASILALDVSGVVRGEVGRIWMPFMPLAFVASFPLLPSREADTSRALAERILIGICLAAVSVTLRLYWDPA